MALFGICDASKIIPEFNGDIGQLNNFIGTVTFYAETLKDATEINKLIKFVLATKLSDRVRNKLVSEETPSTLESFKRIFRKVFTPRKSLSSVHNELAKQVQGSGSVVQFANKIESLVASLNELQIAELGIQNRETIVRVNEQVALSTFKDGLSEPQRTTVMAARPTSLNEAIQIAAEVRPQSKPIMHYRKQFDNNRQRNMSNINTYNDRGYNYNKSYYKNRGRNNNQGYYNNRGSNSSQGHYSINSQGNNYQSSTHPKTTNNHRNDRFRNNRNRNQGRIYITQEQGNEIGPCNPQQ